MYASVCQIASHYFKSDYTKILITEKYPYLTVSQQTILPELTRKKILISFKCKMKPG